MSALDHLEGAPVAILADGLPRSRFVPLDATLLRLIVPRRDHLVTTEWLADPDEVARVTQHGLGWAMLEGGYVIGAGGIAPVWFGRAVVWLLPGENTEPRHLVVAYRFIRRWLDALQEFPAFRRIEAAVRFDFAEGHRFARGLGFRHEGLMRFWGPDGTSHHLYARLRGEGS